MQSSIREQFLEYNRQHPKAMTESIRWLSHKFKIPYKYVREIIGDELIEKVKKFPSEPEREVLSYLQTGMKPIRIADEMKISRQAVNIFINNLIRKGYVTRPDSRKEYYELCIPDEFKGE